ncbi:MAG: DNA-binding protein [Syntrophales bacterium]|nr:DNA-binding protein [Syntrophales bacterium]
MRKTNIIIGAIVGLSLIFVTASWAQRGMGPGGGQGRGWGMGGAYGRIYNPQTVETLSGEVVSVEKFMPGRGMSYGVHFTLKTDKETIPVHLGPSWYLDKQDIKIVPKDQVQVTGSRVTFEGKPAIIAAEVKKGDKVLKLRDQAGVPVWAGQGRR